MRDPCCVGKLTGNAASSLVVCPTRRVGVTGSLIGCLTRRVGVTGSLIGCLT